MQIIWQEKGDRPNREDYHLLQKGRNWHAYFTLSCKCQKKKGISMPQHLLPHSVQLQVCRLQFQRPTPSHNQKPIVDNRVLFYCGGNHLTKRAATTDQHEEVSEEVSMSAQDVEGLTAQVDELLEAVSLFAAIIDHISHVRGQHKWNTIPESQ